MCLGKAVDKLPGATSQPLKNTGLGKWIPTLGESVDPHYMRTNAKAEERHKDIGVHKEMPKVPDPITPPQALKTPDSSSYLNRRNKPGAMSPAGSTLLTSPAGMGGALVGRSTLLGG